LVKIRFEIYQFIISNFSSAQVSVVFIQVERISSHKPPFLPNVFNIINIILCINICTVKFFSPHYFKDIKISALALLKMVMHARSGGILEIMGLLLGKVEGNTMIVMDSFALPVEGTETRVNAQAQAYEYMTAYIESAKVVSLL